LLCKTNNTSENKRVYITFTVIMFTLKVRIASKESIEQCSLPGAVAHHTNKIMGPHEVSTLKIYSS